jgi:threonyl-tRNA synthetase
MMNNERIIRQIDKITQRIFELNQKVDVTISTSELNKIQKLKKKLAREKQKLYDKLYPPQEDENDLGNDTLDSENVDL